MKDLDFEVNTNNIFGSNIILCYNWDAVFAPHLAGNRNGEAYFLSFK